MAQSYNYQVNLAFNADTSRLKSQIDSLQGSLSKLAMPKASFAWDKDLQKASVAAKELSIHINNAYDASSGHLDLSKLNKSISSSNKSLSDYTKTLIRSGEVGTQAFKELAESIALAEYPVLKINKKLADFAKTLKDSFKWQLSNTILNNLYGGLQSAYGYAQDLNKSLNNIRIVTQYSTEDMAKFAEQANKAAKNLSTTTTDYTDASLIYYQQGLKESDVINRTNITIKMANATGESVEEVSNQLTAVWNNFYDGSKSLEYYADVMASLGAATASSSDEIAQGLSKFASVAETVGLSYEYATSALATVTAETRESADTVGNAFKTLFARIQGLSLGETLEDGVNLNKYSEALGKVGIKVLDANGEMREMDDILNDMGNKWDRLSKAEQTALAQTVAGVRQYTHLMSLMENWDKFQDNINIAEYAEGSLDEQAEIYADSWEASSKRVQAAAEGIYNSLIDDEFFIGFNNTLADILSGIDMFIERIGGLKTILISVGSVFMSSLASEIPQAIDNLKHNFNVLTKGSHAAYKEMQDQMMGEIKKNQHKFSFDEIGHLENITKITTAKQKYMEVSDKMTDIERQLAQAQLNQMQNAEDQIQLLKKENAERLKKLALQKESLKKQDIDDIVGSKQSKVIERLEKARKKEQEKFEKGQRASKAKYEIEAKDSKANSGKRRAANLKTAEQVQRAQRNFNLDKLTEEVRLQQGKVGEKKEGKEKNKTVKTTLDTIMSEYFKGSTFYYNDDIKKALEKALRGEDGALESFRQLVKDHQEALETRSLHFVKFTEGASENLIQFLKDLDVGSTSIDVRDLAITMASGNYQDQTEALKLFFKNGSTDEDRSAFMKGLYSISKFKTAEEQKNALTEFLNTYDKDFLSAIMVKGEEGTDINLLKYFNSIISDKNFTGIKNSLEKMEEVFKGATVTYDEKQRKAGARGALGSKGESYIGTQEQYDEANEEINKLNQLINGLNESFNPQHTIRFSEALGSLAGMAGEAWGAIDILKGTISILGDEEASLSEKTSALVTSLGSLGVMAGQFKEGWGTISEFVNQNSESGIFDTKLNGIDNIKKELGEKGYSSVKKIILDSPKDKRDLESIKKKIMAQKSLNKEEKEAIINGLGRINIEKMGAAADETHTLSIWAKIKAMLVEKGLLSAQIIAMTAFIAVIAAVTIAIMAWYSAMATNKEALEEANKSVSDATKRYNELRQEAEELKETISDFSEANKALEDLTKGTKEYEEALESANEKANELIETYELWNREKSYTIEDGRIIIDSEVLKDIQSEADQKVAEAKVDLQGAKLFQTQAKMDLIKEDNLKILAAEIDKYSETEDAEGNRKLIEGYGEKISAIEQAIIDYDFIDSAEDFSVYFQGENENIYKEFEDSIKKISNNFEELSNQSKKLNYELNNFSISVIQSSKKIQDEIKAIAGSDANKAATLEQIYANKLIEDDQTIKDKLLSVEDEIQKINSNTFPGGLQEFLNNTEYGINLETLYSGLDIDNTIFDDRDLALTYAAMKSGISAKELSYSEDQLGHGTVKTADGEIIVNNLEDTFIRRDLAKMAYIEMLQQKLIGEGVSLDTEVLSNIANANYGNIDFGQALLESIANGAKGEIDLSAAFKDLSYEDILQIKNIEGAGDLLRALKIEESSLEALGFSGDNAAKSFKKAFITSLDDWTYKLDLTKVTNLVNTYQDVVKDLKDNPIISEEDLNRLKEFDAGFEKYFMRMADGTYHLTMAAEDFQRITKENIVNQFKKHIEGIFYSIGKNKDLVKTAAHTTDSGVETINTEAANQKANFLKDTIGLDYISDLTDEEKAIIENGPANFAEAQKLDDVYERVLKNPTQGIESAWLSTATTLEELDASVRDIENAKEEAGAENTEVNDEAYQNNLKRLGEQYKNAEDELNAYYKALETGKGIDKAEEALRNAISAGERAEETGRDAEIFEMMVQTNERKYNSGKEDNSGSVATRSSAKEKEEDPKSNVGRKGAEDNELTRNELEEITEAQLDQEEAISDLNEGWEDWEKTLENATEGSEEYYEALKKIIEIVEKLTGLNKDDLGIEFFERDDVQNLLEQIKNGSIEAQKELGMLAGEQYLTNMGVFDKLTEEQKLAYDNAMNLLADQDLEVGAVVDDENFYLALYEMMKAAGMTADEMNKYLGSIGFTGMEEVPTGSLVIGKTYIGEDGKEFEYTQETEVEGKVYYPINEHSPVWKGQSSYTPTKKSSGGGSKKKAEKTKKSDTVERYKEIDDKLENIQRTMDEIDKLTDSLWGESRFDQMEKSIELLEQENDLLEERLEWSRAYLEEDQKALDEAMEKAGVSFTFDPETGNITNYTEEMEKLHKELSDAEDQANKDNNVSDSEQERIDKIKERIEELKSAIEAYEGTLEEMRSDEEKYLDNQLKIWEQRYALLNEKFELGFSINESEMELLEYYLGKIEDDLYSAVEGFALMNDQANIYTENLNSLEQKYNELLTAYQNNEISQANYKEGLQEIQSEIISNLEALNELKDSMLDYYENTLSLAQEEIATYTDRMEHLNSVLDHYSSIMDILGKEQDYVAKGSILSAQAENARNELDVYIQQYESAMAQVAKWEEEMANTTDPIKLEELRGYWLTAQEQAEEAQDNMLSKTQEWAEAMRACVENELGGLAKTLEESLTGGTNFDTMLNSMERASSLQEEYLTTTNQIYETNKLMRQAQQEIDKTTNSVAKRRLANFINETKQLQDQTELSQYELDIQQAKYDLLLAEIALEEAQQAKSTVRLQRDSEGNFGYVYTADSGAIADAEQQLADAQNSLYNIGLEGANDYNQKYAETMQQMYDTLTELQTQYLEGAFDSEEEYQTAVENTKQYFYEKLRQYSSLYQVALTTDSRVVADAWSSDFNDMIYKTEEWKTAVNTYSKEASESLREWGDVVSQVLNESGLNTLDQTIGNVTEQSGILRDTLVGEDGVIKEIQDTLIKAIDEASSKIEAILKLIADTVERSEALMGTVNEEYTNEDTPANTPESPKEEAEETDQSSTSPSAEEQKPDLTKGSFVEVKSGTRWYGDSWGGGGSGTARNGNIKYVNENGSHPYNIDGSGWIKKIDIVGYDTGGYTGDWDGSYGKLAMLHKKELILNESDTKNFLASMEVMERILQILDLQAISSQVGGILTTPAFKNTGNQTIEQHIEIEANFPNATDRLEIEEAFKSMVNLASQYANRK